MSGTGAIPKVPRNRPRRALSDISNQQYHENYHLSTMPLMDRHNSMERKKLRNEIFKSLEVLEGVRQLPAESTLREIQSEDANIETNKVEKMHMFFEKLEREIDTNGKKKKLAKINKERLRKWPNTVNLLKEVYIKEFDFEDENSLNDEAAAPFKREEKQQKCRKVEILVSRRKESFDNEERVTFTSSYEPTDYGSFISDRFKDNEQNNKSDELDEVIRNQREQADRSYFDLRAYDFFEACSKMNNRLEVGSEGDENEQPNILEALKYLNKSLCCRTVEEENLHLKLLQVSSATVQATKLLQMCISTPHLKTSLERIEAERILLLSELKQEMLNENLNTLNKRAESKTKNGCLRISDIRMPLIYSPEADPDKKRYYVVVFQEGDKLYSSGVIEPNQHSYLDVDQMFILEDISKDFTIAVSVYSMYIDEAKKDRKTYRPFKRMKKLFASRRAPEGPICSEQMKSSFVLHGKCVLKATNLHKSPFTINGVPPTICLVNTIECKIETAVNLKDSDRAYLKIGKFRNDGTISWRRKWCVVDGKTIKLWPKEEDEEEFYPEVLNISKCLVKWECMKKCVCK